MGSTGYSAGTDYRRILVAPTTLRPRLVEHIREEAAKGSDGRIMFKMNHLVDPKIIDELYAASGKGCQIDLIVRGNCSLRAGVPGLSENIRALIHRRQVPRAFAGSTGSVTRGKAPCTTWVRRTSCSAILNMRVEAVTPMLPPRIKLRIEEMLLKMLMDDDELLCPGRLSRMGDHGPG